MTRAIVFLLLVLTAADSWCAEAQQYIPITNFGRSLVDDANSTTARSTLGVVVGVDVQAHDEQLDVWAVTQPTDFAIDWLALTTAPEARDFIESGVDLATLEPDVWLRADTVSEVHGATVQTVEDQSGNNRDFAQATSGARPTVQAGVLRSGKVLDFDSTDDLLIGPNALAGSNALTVVVVMSADVVDARGFAVSKHGAFNAANGEWVLRIPPSEDNVCSLQFSSFSNAGSRSTQARCHAQHPSLGISAVTWAQGESPTLYQNGAALTAYENTGWSTLPSMPTTTEPLRVGYVPSHTNPSGGQFAELLIWNRKLSADELATVHAELKRRHWRRQVVCDGDSMTSGKSSGTDPTNWRPWPSQMEPLLSERELIFNFGVNAQTLEDIMGDAGTQIDPLVEQRYISRDYICWAGTNDWAFGDGPIAAKTYYQRIGRERFNAGYDSVVIATSLPRSDTGDEQDRQDFNASLREDFEVPTSNPLIWRANPGVTYATVLVDVAGDERIGDEDDDQDLDYYIDDGVHLNNDGAAIVADLFRDALEILHGNGSGASSGDLGTMASQDADDVAITGGTLSVSTLATSGAVVHNDAGAAVNFRVESDGNANIINVDGTNNRVGFGVAPSYPAHFGGATLAANGLIGTQFDVTVTPTASSGIGAMRSTLTMGSGGAAGGTVTSNEAEVISSTTNKPLTMLGYLADMQNLSSGTVTNAASFTTGIAAIGSGATVTTARGFHARDGFESGGGSIVAQYGLYVDSLTSADVNVAILTNAGLVIFNETGSDADVRIEGDTNANLFFTDASVDRVGVKTNAPLYDLDVNGSFRASTTVILTSLPTSEPATVGQLWNDGGTLKVSDGP